VAAAAAASAATATARVRESRSWCVFTFELLESGRGGRTHRLSAAEVGGRGFPWYEDGRSRSTINGIAGNKQDPGGHRAAWDAHIRAAELHERAAELHELAANLHETHAAHLRERDGRPASVVRAERLADVERVLADREHERAAGQRRHAAYHAAAS
jgi:hypothetical protein